MSSCISCGTAPPCSGCSSTQVCVQTARQCNKCPESICVADPTLSDSSSSGSSKKGGTSPVGPAVGSVVGILVIAGVLGWIWYLKKKKNERERRERREVRERKKSVMQSEKGGAEVSGVSSSGEGTGVVKRKSLSRLSPSSPNFPETSMRSGASMSISSSMEVNGHHTTTLPHAAGRERNSKDPFADINAVDDDDRSDTYTFRSSQSTSIIPIAYIPAHSSSPAIGDLQGLGPYGEEDPDHDNGLGRRPSKRNVGRESQISMENIRVDLAAPPPLLSSPGGGIMKINGVPIRPPRAPDLDLKLPEEKKKLSVMSASSSLAPPTPTLRSPMDPLLGTRVNGGADSRLSTFSTSSSLDSHMSYILDSPQIVTPHSLRMAQGGKAEVKRVEVVGLAKVGLTTLKRSNSTATNGGPSTSKVPQLPPMPPSPKLEDPFSDRNAVSANGERRHNPMDSISNVSAVMVSDPSSPDSPENHNPNYPYGRPGTSQSNNSDLSYVSRSDEVTIDMNDPQMLDINSDQRTLRGGKTGSPGGPRSPRWQAQERGSMLSMEGDEASDRDSIWTSTSGGFADSRSNSLIITTATKLPIATNQSPARSLTLSHSPSVRLSPQSSHPPQSQLSPANPHMSYASSRDSMASQMSSGVLDGIPFEIGGASSSRDSTASSVFTTGSRFSDYQMTSYSTGFPTPPPLPTGAQGQIERHQASGSVSTIVEAKNLETPKGSTLRQEVVSSPPPSSTASSFEIEIGVDDSPVSVKNERSFATNSGTETKKVAGDRTSIDTVVLSEEVTAQFKY